MVIVWIFSRKMSSNRFSRTALTVADAPSGKAGTTGLGGGGTAAFAGVVPMWFCRVLIWGRLQRGQRVGEYPGPIWVGPGGHNITCNSRAPGCFFQGTHFGLAPVLA